MSCVSQSPVQAGTAGVRCRPSAVINQALSASHCCPRCCCAGGPRAPPPPLHRPTALLRSGCHHHARIWERRRPCGTEASLLGCSAAQRCPRLWWCLTSRSGCSVFVHVALVGQAGRWAASLPSSARLCWHSWAQGLPAPCAPCPQRTDRSRALGWLAPLRLLLQPQALCSPRLNTSVSVCAGHGVGAMA